MGFLTLIAFPYLNGKLNLIADISSSENRQMTAKPELDFKRLDAYPKKYEAYFNDHFSIRSRLVKYFNLLNIIIFKKSPLPEQVIIGHDEWFFLAGHELDSYIGKDYLLEAELDSFSRELSFRKNYLAERNCKFYFCVVPAKTNIYSDKIPGSIYRIHKPCWGEQLNTYLIQHSDVNPIDLYQVLRSKKQTDNLYLKLDNHWNRLGAFYAANELLARLQKDIPGILTNSLRDYQITKTVTNNGNVIAMLSDIDFFSDYDVMLTPVSGFKAVDVPPVGYPCVPGFPYCGDYEKDKEINNPAKPRLLLIADSFGENAFPFLAEHFSRSVKIFDSWEYKLNEDIVEKEKPDVVILMALEANIRSLLRHQSRFSLKK